MKLKNLKKHFKKQIISGMREYLDIKVPYKLLGLDDKFLKVTDIERLLDLKWSGEDSGLVDHYYMLDYNNMFNNQPLNVHLSFEWGFYLDIDLKHYPNLLYIQRDNRHFYISGHCGYKNPKCIYDEENGYPEDEPYWLYKGDEEHENHSFYYSIGEDSEEVRELLERYANSSTFSSDLFSGNFFYQLVSGNIGQNIKNDLNKDLSKLTTYCKTTYQKFTKDYIIITYAIRYKENVSPFLTDLKKLIKKHKIKI